MGKSKQQQAILELGKLLVEELDLVKSVDTLSRWMAHFIAEKIKYAESLPQGPKKTNAEKECFSLILDLWKHRWSYKPDRRPLRNFDQLFDTLQNLDPKREQPYFFHLTNQRGKKDDDANFDMSKSENLLRLALHVDKVARIWINNLLNRAADKAKDKRTKKIIDQAISLPDSKDIHIIRAALIEWAEDESVNKVDRDELIRKEKIESLNYRIEELQRFGKFNEYLIGQFETERDELVG